MISLNVGAMTVKEFWEFMSLLKDQDYTISICGMTDSYYFNFDTENHNLIIDTENLSERE